MRMLTETPAGRAAPTAVAVRARHVVRALLAAAACLCLSGCYLLQAAGGEWGVLRARVPIDKVLTDPRTPAPLHARLAQVRAAREFAVRELGLPDNQSYRSYADIGRPYVVWNVVATPEFSVRPAHWCFPVAGCVAYRGYFREQRARDFAASLVRRGFDVAVEGVPAYSTLGHFADPVLSSMLRYGDDDLAATIFHELAHQLLYVRDDSSFNEAFATTVESTGLERWLRHEGQAEHIQVFRAAESHEQALIALLAEARARLTRLYASGAAPAELRAQKADVFRALADDIRALEKRLGVTFPLYDEWMATGLNNAHLASVATYYDCVPGFTRLLEEQGNDLSRFYAAARELARKSRAERDGQLCGHPETDAD